VIETREGLSIPVEASYGIIRDEDGEIVRVVLVFRDISHQKELDHLRAEIVANVSHELRTPLALIKGYATTLLSPNVALDEEEARRFLSNTSIAADRLGRMIDDLLWTSRLETKELGLRARRFDLAQKISQILTWFAPHAQGRRLAADLTAERLMVWADPDRVEQVLFNLLTNAVKYSALDSTITVQARCLGDSQRAVVHVCDEGPGIAPEHLPHIFERFYLTEISEEGVGLGLFICKELVQAMGGEIWVVSEVDQGSTFSFALPVEGGTERS
jgi:two-component system phosphate regulon sensor histidine kinase PhoR